MKKNVVTNVLDLFGDDFELERLIETLLFINKVDAGFKDADENKLLDFEDVKRRFSNLYNK